MHWLTDEKATILAARFLLEDLELNVVDGERDYIRQCLREFCNKADAKDIQASLLASK